MITSDLEILVAARELISDPARHTRRELARNAEKTPVSPLAAGATCWCSKGAIIKVTNGDWDAADRLEPLLSSSNTHADGSRCGSHYTGFNDVNPHDRVMAMWDKAIDRLTNPAAHDQIAQLFGKQA